MDISATDISARTFRPQTFRPSKMPKVDVSAKTINVCIFVCLWGIDVDVCGMYVHVFTCMHAVCMPVRCLTLI